MSKNMHLIYFSLLNSLYFAIYQYIKCSLRFLQGNGDIYTTIFLYKSLIIISFARSITDVSIEARYICVVAMES